jgi:hypothetical protein
MSDRRSSIVQQSDGLALGSRSTTFVHLVTPARPVTFLSDGCLVLVAREIDADGAAMLECAVSTAARSNVAWVVVSGGLMWQTALDRGASDSTIDHHPAGRRQTHRISAGARLRRPRVLPIR